MHLFEKTNKNLIVIVPIHPKMDVLVRFAYIQTLVANVKRQMAVVFKNLRIEWNKQ